MTVYYTEDFANLWSVCFWDLKDQRKNNSRSLKVIFSILFECKVSIEFINKYFIILME